MYKNKTHKRKQHGGYVSKNTHGRLVNVKSSKKSSKKTSTIRSNSKSKTRTRTTRTPNFRLF